MFLTRAVGFHRSYHAVTARSPKGFGTLSRGSSDERSNATNVRRDSGMKLRDLMMHNLRQAFMPSRDDSMRTAEKIFPQRSHSAFF
jgi:hypothetical protein